MVITNLLVAFLSVLTFGSIQNSEQNNLKSDCRSVASFLEKNLNLFVQAVNKECDESDDVFTCSSIENKNIVYVEDSGKTKETVLLDFDGTNGYLLLADDFEILNFSPHGNSPFDGIVADRYKYSPYSGFYYELNGQVYDMTGCDSLDSSLFSGGRQHYDGQASGMHGCGGIESPATYINNCYGSSYNLVSSKSLSVTRFKQNTLSCYFTVSESGSYTGEGNCGLVAGYHAMQCLQRTKWQNMPSVSARCLYDPYIYEPNEYFKRFDITGRPLYENVAKQDNDILENWPTLYKEARMYAVNSFNRCNDFIVNQVSATIEHIASNYGYSVDAREDPLYKFSLDKGINEINNDEPLVFYVSNDETYGAHFVTVNGYKKYQERKRVWIFDVVNTVILYEIVDGWSNYARYYDMSATSSLGMLIFIDIK